LPVAAKWFGCVIAIFYRQENVMDPNWQTVFGQTLFLPLQPLPYQIRDLAKALAASREIFQDGIAFGQRIIGGDRRLEPLGLRRNDGLRDGQKREDTALETIGRKLRKYRLLKGLPETAGVVIFCSGVHRALETTRFPTQLLPRALVTTDGLRSKYLPLVLWSIPEGQRQDLFQHLDWSAPPVQGWNRQTWQKDFAGACAVVRLAHAFQQIGVDIFLPPIYYDALHSGDLVVTTNDHLLYLQIKGDADMYRAASLVVVSSDQEAATKHGRLLAGCRRFNDDTGLCAAPVFATIGLSGYRPEKVECPEIVEAVKSFLGGLSANSEE